MLSQILKYRIDGDWEFVVPPRIKISTMNFRAGIRNLAIHAVIDFPGEPKINSHKTCSTIVVGDLRCSV
jgi:hypothetical protein